MGYDGCRVRSLRCGNCKVLSKLNFGRVMIPARVNILARSSEFDPHLYSLIVRHKAIFVEEK